MLQSPRWSVARRLIPIAAPATAILLLPGCGGSNKNEKFRKRYQPVRAQLTAAGTRVESDLRSIVAAAATHSASTARQASASLVTDFLAVRSADRTLWRKAGAK